MSDGETLLLDGAIDPAVNTRLFGHAAAEDFLARGYSSGKPHHAILIEGPEGIGKATLAYRFAHHVLSHPDPTTAPERLADPNPDTSVSRQMASGASHNLLHLARPWDDKGKKFRSEITVEEARRVGKFFSQTTGNGNWRIVIVDPADDLNRAAANALLKLLEEPPKRSLFLVLSHAPGRLLPTIRSRCQMLTLQPLSDGDLRQALVNLGLSERSLDPAVLSAARGSVAEALKLINYGGAEILAAMDRALTGQPAPARKIMHQLGETLAGKGNDVIFDLFIRNALDRLRDMARAKVHAGDLTGAERLARLSSETERRFALADAYNLDRRQTVVSVLEDLRQA